MKRSRRLLILVASVLLAPVVAFFVYQVVVMGWHPLGWPDKVVGSVEAGDKTIKFYVDYSWDFACFGYFVKDGAGRRRYFPLRGSVYRGLNPMTVDVCLSDSQEEMWVLTDMNSQEECSYFRADNDFITAHGYDATWPAKFDRSPSDPPPLPPEAKKVLSMTLGEER